MYMNSIVAVTCLVLVALTAHPEPAGPPVDDVKKGEVKLKKAGFGGKGAFEVAVGKTVKGKAKFFIDDFFGKTIINANISVENTGDKPMHCHYYVSFHDGTGAMVGCASQGSFGDEGMEPGKKENFGSCLIYLSKEKIASITHYQIAYYESEKPIGK